MNTEHNVERVCLEVFSEVSAVVTHEMRNILAIINEGAGLLDDFAEMAGPEGQLPAGRVLTSSTSIAAQVLRGNTLMKHVNSYAHSVDSWSAEVNIFDIVDVMASLSSRKAVQRKITVRVEVDKSHHITTSPVYLLSATYLCLVGLFSAVPEGETITISSFYDANLSIRFDTSKELGSGWSPEIDERLQTVLPHMSATVEVTKSGIALMLLR